MADGDGGVLVQQQHGHGFADDVAAAHHHGALPAMGMRYRLSISMMPAGVQARGPGSPATRLPTLQGWKPSTSFCG